MKTTIDLPDELLKEAKATAAMRGESLRQLVSEALKTHLAKTTGRDIPRAGWRRAFGLARPSEVDSVDRIISEDLERIDPSDWL